MFVICKRYSFSYAHHLPNHKGKCKRQHGHNAIVEVAVSSPSLVEEGTDDSSEGMVIDFDDLDAIVKPIIEELDHQDLNEAGLECVPTAENIADIISLAVRSKLVLLPRTRQIHLEFVRFWETDKAYAEWRP